MRMLIIAARFLLGSVTLFAVIWQARILDRQGVFDAFNYLGYFTNLSNIVAAVILVISALYLIHSRKPSPTDDLIRGAAVLYMTVTGIVYVTLLTGEDLGLLAPWINILLHIVMPLAVVADWLYRPPGSRLTLWRVRWWFAFPLLFLVYSLIRGASVDWYPYPFLNPDKVGGYGGVALYCLGILAAFCLAAGLVVRAGNILRRKR